MAFYPYLNPIFWFEFIVVEVKHYHKMTHNLFIENQVISNDTR